MPLTGNHPSHIEKIIINMGPRKKCGIEIKKILALMIILSINNM
jgi:hypothetical protein